MEQVMRATRLPVGLLTMLLLGCGDSSGPEPPDLSGAWRGGLLHVSGDTTGVFVLSLSDLNEIVSGTGFFTNGVDTLPLTFSGSHRHPNLVFTMTSPGFVSVGYASEVAAPTEARGVLNGSGFAGDSLILRKQ
jgi:hypothetical protein